MMMLIIFFFSSQSSSQLPNFDWADSLVKKAGHVLGYAILAFLYWRALGFGRNTRRVAWLLALSYALTDEFHQTFVPGRYPAIWDVLIFDNVGALVSLWLAAHYRKQKRSDPFHPIAGQTRH